MNPQVLILGGGASGLMAGAALTAAGRRVLLLEKAPRVGRKLAATGNGRCNLTNLTAAPASYGAAADFVSAALDAFPPGAVIERFEQMGVVCGPADEEGRVYPMSNQASSVLDVLRTSFAEAGGEERTEFSVSRLERSGGMWTVRSSEGKPVSAPVVLCAMGGQAAPNLGGCPDGLRIMKPLGHRATPCLPALTPIKCEHPRLRALKGIRAAGALTLLVDKKPAAFEKGEILFQDYGLSGIAVMQLSGTAAAALSKNRRVEIELDLCGIPREQLLRQLTRRRASLSARLLENFLTGWLPKRLGQTLLRVSGVEDLTAPAFTLPDEALARLADAMTGWRLPVTAVMGFQQAQVTRGGLERGGFDPRTLASRLQDGLYAAGEVLDVDGPCGGYNLQWAWSSALLAAREINRRLG